MQTEAVDNVVMTKTRELCQTLLDQPEVREMRQRIDSFMANEQARSQYESVVSKGQALQQKQQQAQPLSGDEIAEFEKHRDALLNNPVAKGFLDAQEELHQLQHSVSNFVNKTLELGRVPTAEDFESGCCGGGGHDHGHGHGGGGCGCSH